MMDRIEGVIFDWAGTTVDFGCFAPVNVFVEIFNMKGIEVTLEEARKPMGMLKWDHIKAMLEMPRIGRLWEEKFGRKFDDADVDELYSHFESMLMESLSQYTDPIPHVVEAVEELKEQGFKIGSTTGYNNKMMEVVTAGAREKGYSPDFWVTPDSTGLTGRPYPYMVFKNMQELRLSAPWRVVKVGDTVSDIKEGVNSGAWSVGVAIGSSQMGLDKDDFESLSEKEKAEAVEKAKEGFVQAGAHFVIDDMRSLIPIIEEIDGLLEQGKRPGCMR